MMQSKILKLDSVKILLVLTYNVVLMSFVINCLRCCLTCLLHITQIKCVFSSIGVCEMCGENISSTCKIVESDRPGNAAPCKT